jgi:hypothetical protein
MIRVVCGCGRVFKAEDRHSGRRTRCPVCGANLTIGQTPVSSSSGADLEEIPSWWYPSDPQGPPGAEGPPPAGIGNPEGVRTAILPAVPEPGSAARWKDPAEPTISGDGPRPTAGSVVAGRWLWAVTGAAVVVLLGLWVLCCMWATAPGRNEGRAARGPAHSREADRGVAPAVVEDRPARAARRLRLLVPAYIYPAGKGREPWRRLIDAAAKVDLVAIVNPDSGPGVERNPVYASAIAEAADSGVKLVGYVHTQYGERPAAEVKGDIDAWVRFYPRIVGFFLDQQPQDPRHAADFADIAAHARGKLRDAIVITNPGVPCDEEYLARRASDVVCVFANYEGFASFELPAPLKDYDPSHFAALAYQVTDAEAMRFVLKEAIIKQIGYIYVTDGKLPNPWGQLPAYWDAEVDALTHLH